MITALQDWLAEHGSRHDRISVSSGDSRTRGVMAAVPICAGQEVLAIPCDCLVTAKKGMRTAVGLKLLKELNLHRTDPNHWLASASETRVHHIFLSLFLLVDHAACDTAFQPFLSSLPTHYNNMPMCWSSQELAFLQGSPLLQEVVESRAAAARWILR